MTSYDGQAITYDAIGNPLSYIGGLTFTWQNGRRLATAASSGMSANYTYNDSGIRTSKTVNGATTNYYLDGDYVVTEITGSSRIDDYYDDKGDLFGFKYNGSEYYYIRNGQNDIIGILDANGNKVVSYSYDSWGKLLSTTGSLASTVGAVNPYRYRGYRYDTETGLYYLGSRYYDPNTGRFLNADDFYTLWSDKDNLLSVNLFAYCENNPIVKSDPSGNGPEAAVLGLPLLGLGPAGWVAYGLYVAVVIGVTVYIGYMGYKAARQYINYAKSRNRPREGGIPNSSELHKGQDGTLDGYTTYGRDGEVRKQVRFKGKPHGNIKRPNVKVPKYNKNPKTGKKYRNGWKVRKAWKWELPKGYR